jgi:hypothetical protein
MSAFSELLGGSDWLASRNILEKGINMTNLEAKIPQRVRAVAGYSIVVFFLIMEMSLAASAAAHSPQRDAAAISTLQNSIIALGGSNAVAAIQDCIVTGTIANQNGTNNSFTWTTSGNEFRIETTTTKGGTVYLSGHGSPAWIMNGNTSALNSFMARANPLLYLPAYALLQKLNNPIYTLKYVGVVQLNGANVVQVHISDDSDSVGTMVTPQDWFFDPVSFLPVRAQFREPANENAADFTNATVDMSQFVQFGPILVPSTISYTEDNGASKIVTVVAVAFNSGVPPSVFDPPQGGQQ